MFKNFKLKLILANRLNCMTGVLYINDHFTDLLQTFIFLVSGISC